MQGYKNVERVKPSGLELVDKLVEEHRPGSLEKSTSGFEDIINSF